MIFLNKKVALVGPAEHITKKKQDLSEYLVVRLNRVYPMSKELIWATGDKTDVLYIHPDTNFHKDWGGVKQIRLRPDGLWGKTQERKPLNRYFNYRHKIKTIDPDFFYNLNVGCEPNIGLIAMAEILSEKPKELYVTGITFFKTGYDHQYNLSEKQRNRITESGGNIYKHKADPQIVYFKKYIKPFIKMDNELKKI